MDKVKIYIVRHSPSSKLLLPDSIYFPIRVGEYADLQKNEFADNVGESIWYLNSSFCELTALYWIWKNDKSSEIVGLCHYRRFFTKAPISVKERFFLKDKDITKYLKKNNVIVPRTGYFWHGTKSALYDCVFPEDIIKMENILFSMYPDYRGDYCKMVNKASGNYLFNMFICRKDLFDQYCEWLFPILLELDKNVDTTGYDRVHKRIYGYISERLLGVWIRHNNIKVKSVRVINVEEDISTKWYLREIIRLTPIPKVFKTITTNAYLNRLRQMSLKGRKLQVWGR